MVAVFKCHIFELLPLCESRRLHNLEFFPAVEIMEFDCENCAHP